MFILDCFLSRCNNDLIGSLPCVKSPCDIIDMLLNDTSKLDSILDYLGVNGHILTVSMLEEIQSKRTYGSRIRRLLDIIPKTKRGPHAYYLLLNCLKDHGFDTLRTLFIANGSSGAGCGENHAHPDTSMKLCPNIHYYELFENFSLANPN